MPQQLRIKAALGFAWQPAKGSRVILRRDDLAFKSNRNDLSRDLNNRRDQLRLLDATLRVDVGKRADGVGEMESRQP